MLDFDNNVGNASPFPTESELYFRVAERELGWKNARSNEYTGINKQKALVREFAGGGKWLANVGIGFELIENCKLFPYVEKHFIANMDEKYLHNVEVIEHQSYGGRDCYREYRFHDLKCDMRDGVSDIAYRAIVGNSYGNKAVTLLSGAIDFFCANGMLVGQSEKQTRKHTSGFTMTGVGEWIDASLTQFTSHSQRIQMYDETRIDLTKEDALFEHLVSKGMLSRARAKQAQSAMHEECNIRAGGDARPTMWHLYSALTDWATHAKVRDTGQDHEANTRIQRTQHVERVIRAAEKMVMA